MLMKLKWLIMILTTNFSREAPNDSANDIKWIMFSMSKPAAVVRAKAIACSCCKTFLRPPIILRSWTLQESSIKDWIIKLSHFNEGKKQSISTVLHLIEEWCLLRCHKLTFLVHNIFHILFFWVFMLLYQLKYKKWNINISCFRVIFVM